MLFDVSKNQNLSLTRNIFKRNTFPDEFKRLEGSVPGMNRRESLMSHLHKFFL